MHTALRRRLIRFFKLGCGQNQLLAAHSPPTSPSQNDFFQLYTANMAMAPSPLLDIPPELTELIASFLDGPDLLTLRLVNQGIAARSERHMLKKNFSELRIILDFRPSVNKALEVVNHARLRTGIKLVHVYASWGHHTALDKATRLDLGGHSDSAQGANAACDDRHLLQIKWLEDREWLIDKTFVHKPDFYEILCRLRECRDLDIDIYDLVCLEEMLYRRERKFLEKYGDAH